MIRFWGQQKFEPKTGRIMGYELFLRERSGLDGKWRLPEDFSKMSAHQVTSLLVETIDSLPMDLDIVSFNLDQRQFVDPEYRVLLPNVQRLFKQRVVVELTERLGQGYAAVLPEELRNAARGFADLGISVCLDDVGTGFNQLELVDLLNPFVDEYKYALQNVRDVLTYAEIGQQVAAWKSKAHTTGKVLALEGVETSGDVSLIDQFRPDIVQGYYYGTPHALPVPGDFSYSTLGQNVG
ncbi:EAL domain-containing protein [Lacticaseibacillus hulanensis]|uniref:EAL domain-containing protein n=1 Tax=Lacticaseibacillus hulanensis TaxID=2493111 RepID=UPI000FDC94DE|nr:EAL domain-containing protein [Lacticaseibacillus hulanensis]